MDHGGGGAVARILGESRARDGPIRGRRRGADEGSEKRPAGGRPRSDAQHAGAPASAKTASQIVLASLPLAGDEEPRGILESLGRLWMAGAKVDWQASMPTSSAAASCCPLIRLSGKRYWPESAPVAVAAASCGHDDGRNAPQTAPVVQAAAAAPSHRFRRNLRFHARIACWAATRSLLQELSGYDLVGCGPVHRSPGTGSGFAAADAGRHALPAQVRRADHLPPVDGGAELV